MYIHCRKENLYKFLILNLFRWLEMNRLLLASTITRDSQSGALSFCTLFSMVNRCLDSLGHRDCFTHIFNYVSEGRHSSDFSATCDIS